MAAGSAVAHADSSSFTSMRSAPEGLPVELPEHAAYLRLLTRGAEEPSAEEKAVNPRSASARLRVAERTRSTKGQHR